MISKYLTLICFVSMLMCSFAMAESINIGNMTVTLMPESSLTHPVGTWGNLTSDPLGPFLGLSCAYEGITQPSGSSEYLPNGLHLVFRVRLDFSTPVTISNIIMSGWGWYLDNSLIRLLDSSGQVLSTQTITGLNTGPGGTVDGQGATGTTFYFDEFDASGNVSMVNSVIVNYTSVPEPSEFLLLCISGVVGVIGYGWKYSRG